MSSSNEIVSWTGKESGSPTAAACAALISTQGIGAVNVVTGHTYCYKTGDGNIAVIVPTRETVKEDGSVSNVLARVTVGAYGSPAPAPNVSWSKQWGPGTLLLSDNVYDDLDSVPPDVTGNSNSSNVSVLLYSGQFVSSSNEIVSWTGKESGSPTAAACAALISTRNRGRERGHGPHILLQDRRRQHRCHRSHPGNREKGREREQRPHPGNGVEVVQLTPVLLENTIRPVTCRFQCARRRAHIR